MWIKIIDHISVLAPRNLKVTEKILLGFQILFQRINKTQNFNIFSDLCVQCQDPAFFLLELVNFSLL